ncbi:MAG: Gfo/Idh/MocA family oxidoreductase [Ruminococcaceae bacterium]|nr:Gfo/Idh/MocA family oxidoreductase [Oscillospiraceae bacterium]
MDEKKIKIGCVGLGPRGADLFYNRLCAVEGTEPVAVCDLDAKKVENCIKELEKRGHMNVKSFTDFAEFLKSDVEAVLVATDVTTHATLAAQAMDAGKHVLCEIPNIRSVEEGKMLAEAVRRNPGKFMVAENCCYWAHINAWKQMYEEGLLGDVVYAESDYLHPAKEIWHPEVKREKTWRSYMPAIHYLTHNLGPILYILNDTVAEVSGFIPDINPIEEAHPAPPNGVAMVKTKKGTVIKIFIGFGVCTVEGSCHNFGLYGSKGCVQTARGNTSNQGKTMASFKHTPYLKGYVDIPVYPDYPGKSSDGHSGADFIMMEDFIRCIREDKEPALGIDFGLSIALPGILADISSREHGKTMQMPDFA